MVGVTLAVFFASAVSIDSSIGWLKIGTNLVYCEYKGNLLLSSLTLRNGNSEVE